MKLWHKLAVLAAAVVLCVVLLLVSIFAPACSGRNSDDVPKLVISEIMADNTLTLSDSDGEYSDWIEICNIGSIPAELSRYCLSDDENAPFKWVMPDVILEPGEYLLVFASGKDIKNMEEGEYHTNFKLNGMGEDMVLSSAYYGISEPFSYAAAVADVSFGLTADGTYKWLSKATPKAENDETQCADDPLSLNSPYLGLIISEYMTANEKTLSDSDGEFTDWIEITNISTKDISLDGLQITDNIDNLDKWKISGSYILAPGECAVVFMSGKDRCDSEIHSAFGIGRDDREIVLSDKHSRVVYRIALTELREGISGGADSEGEALYFEVPTPGRENEEGAREMPIIRCPMAGAVRINEVCAAAVSSSTGRPARDWIELYNDSDETVSLKGYGLSNDENDPYRFTFTNEKIGPHSYCVIYAVGAVKATRSTAPFKISTDGETLVLTSPEGETLDIFETGKLRIGVTSGRRDEKGGERLYFASPTRGAENSEGYTSYTSRPEFSVDAGAYSESVTVEIKAQDNAAVYYTTNGSEPTASSKLYSGAIEVDKTCVIRAKAYIDGSIPSDTVTATYLINETHQMPIVSLAGNPKGLFSEETGIYANGKNGQGSGDPYPFYNSNYWQDWERAVSFEYIADGKEAVAFDAGTKIYGQFTRTYKQKAFAVHLRDVYGNSQVTFPFFGEDNSCVNVKGLVLRAGGQDNKAAKIRDAFCSQVVLRGGIDLLTADWQPVALYINGDYWGLYNLREKINEDYLEMNCGINKEEVTILKGPGQIELAGSNDEFRELLSFVKNNNMGKSSNYKYVCSKIDIDNYIDYIICVSFFKNNDLGNSRYYLDGKDGKWRWIMYDLDISMRNEAGRISGGYSFEQVEDKEPLHRNLLENKDYRNAFIERYAELLNTVFMPDNLTGILDEMTVMIEPEIRRNASRWTDQSYSRWKSEIAALRNVCLKRRDVVKSQLKSYFELSNSKMKKLFPNG